MSCPYLSEANGQAYCGYAARRLSPQRASGTCESGSYTSCEYYSSDEEEKGEFDD